jgi:hypothetical protein
MWLDFDGAQENILDVINVEPNEIEDHVKDCV